MGARSHRLRSPRRRLRAFAVDASRRSRFRFPSWLVLVALRIERASVSLTRCFSLVISSKVDCSGSGTLR
jgi:hypothetical protein